MLQNALASLKQNQSTGAFKKNLDSLGSWADNATNRMLYGYKSTYGKNAENVNPQNVPLPPPKPQMGGAAPPGAQGGDILQQAREAISRGAPRDKVIQRLRQNGIDASGL